MALPIFETKDKIPAGFEEEYEESQDGKWHPVDRVGRLEKAIKTEREAREKAENLAKKAARDAAEAEAKRNASAAGVTDEEYKKVYASLESTYKPQIEEKDALIAKLNGELRGMKLDGRIKALFKANGALDARVDDFWKLHGDEFDLTADDKPLVRNEPGKDIVRHVQAIMKARPEWVQGTKAAGGRTSSLPSTASSSAPNPGGLTFEDVIKNPAAAIAVANEA